MTTQDTSPQAIHARCKNDIGYALSVAERDPINMQRVLRAYDYPHSVMDAYAQLDHAEYEENILFT